MEGGRVFLVVLWVVAAGSVPLLLVPPLGAYLMVGAVLLWRWARPRSPDGTLKAVTRIVVWAMFGIHLLWLGLAIGLCGPTILVFECGA